MTRLLTALALLAIAAWLMRPRRRWVNADGSPCFCGLKMGHTRECVERRAAWLTRPRRAYPVALVCPECEARVLVPDYLDADDEIQPLDVGLLR